MKVESSIQSISVIVPRNPFVQSGLQSTRHCLAALNVEKLMDWWPGKPHFPHRDPAKVRAIQRSLDWKRVAQIAAYLLQQEIVDAPDRIDEHFRSIYEPKKSDPGRQWPPRIARVVGYERSEFPTFSNVLLHVNGARVEPLPVENESSGTAARLIFNEEDANLKFSVIDGQHRINGAYLAVNIRRETDASAVWEIPSDIFIDLDPPTGPPRHQAQIFIDVNFYQKKVDRSLVADLFPTARATRGPLDDKERAQDLGRKLMLETGPLVGMIQIPGIKFGVRDVVTLATLASAIEDALPTLRRVGLAGLEEQAEFLAQCLDSWLKASGRQESAHSDGGLDPENVAYQGRVLVSMLTLLPACIWTLRRQHTPLVSDAASDVLAKWFGELMDRARLRDRGKFLPKGRFKQKGFLGSGGAGRLRDTLWAAALATSRLSRLSDARVAALANAARTEIAQKVRR